MERIHVPPADHAELPHGIELRHLRYFVAVAEERHFGRAAERLGMAQPPLSQQIARLEALVGSALFTRRPRVALTESGQVLLSVARRTLGQVAQGIDAARRAGRGETGVISVGFAASTTLTALPHALRAYRSAHPDVELVLREMATSAQLEALAAGTLDVGFLREPTPVDGLVMEPVVRETFMAVLPPAHPLRASPQVPLQHLAGEPFVLFPRRVAPTLHDQVITLCHRAGFEPHRVQEAQEWLTIVGLVDAGLGVSLVPASFARLRWGGVTYHALDLPSSTSVAMCRRSEEPTPVVASFLAIVRAELTAPPA